MLLDELLKISDLFANNDLEKDYSNVFFAPYYQYIESQVESSLSKINKEFSAKFSGDIAFQVVSYVYKNYFKYIYTFEYQLAKQNKLFQERNNSEGINDFITKISCSREWIEYLFEKYPILYNIINDYSIHILDYISEIILHFLQDSDVLLKVFGVNSDSLESIQLFKGDLHDWRCVSLLEFKNGTAIYYKPRNANNEEFLQSMITELNKSGLDITLGIPNFISKKNYSWHLHICGNGSCSINMPEYCYNWGKLQCMFYVLGTQDIIPDNILYNQGIPYIIDCESIVLRPYHYHDGNALSVYLQKSVLKTGILPDWMFDDANQRTSISSVLFRFKGGNKHLPHTSKDYYSMSRENIGDFISGFSNAYAFFSNNKQSILTWISNSRIDELYSRVLIHPTMIYSCLLNEQMTPEYLAGVKNLQPLLSSLVHKRVYGTHTKSITESIKKQIVSGNIPYFYSIGNKACLYSGTMYNVCYDFYRCPNNTEWIADKLESLSNQDLKYQCNIIKETLKFYFDITEDRVQYIEPEKFSEFPKNVSYIEAALGIYKRIENYEIQVGDLIGYVGKTKCLYDGAFQIALHNNSIYDGVSGLCIFFMTLYYHTHDENLLYKAKALFRQMCNDIESINISVEECKDIPISPLTGITGVIYLMECFHSDLYHEPTYTFIINKLKEIIPLTKQYDYMSGITGLICLLFQAKLINNTEKMELISLCGKRLLELGNISNGMMSWTYLDGSKYTVQRTMILGGYSHGSASICVAFYLLYLTTKDTLYKDAFKMALKHDRSFFSEEIGGWIDGRDPENKIDSGSWCHGSAGIALSRLQLLSLGYKDSIINKELDIAVSQIKKRLSGNLSICHGVMGNIEILHALENLGYKVDVDLSLCERKIIHDILNKSSIWCGDDDFDSLIGLFMGIAGVGYQLLRVYSWEKVPSVMSLEINTKNIYMHQRSQNEKN